MTDLESELYRTLASLLNCLADEPWQEVTMKLHVNTIEAKIRGTELVNRIALDYPAGSA